MSLGKTKHSPTPEIRILDEIAYFSRHSNNPLLPSPLPSPSLACSVLPRFRRSIVCLSLFPSPRRKRAPPPLSIYWLRMPAVNHRATRQRYSTKIGHNIVPSPSLPPRPKSSGRTCYCNKSSSRQLLVYLRVCIPQSVPTHNLVFLS